MKFGLRRSLLTILLTVRFATVVQAYGPLGHEIVGAVADERLANTPTSTKIRALLDGFTLEKAAVIADEIKGWDKNGVDDPRSFHSPDARRKSRRAFASLVPLYRRSSRAGPKVPGRFGRPQQMGCSSHDSILHSGLAGTSA
jgi:hypothetical protein